MKPIILTLLLFLKISLTAQEISISKIEEVRSDFENVLGNICKIELKITGDSLKKYTDIRLNQIIKALDDQNQDLIKQSTWGNKYSKISENGIIEIELRKSAREAKKIKELEGNIALFMPSFETNSEVHVPHYKSFTNRNLLAPKLPFKLYYITRSSLIKLKSETKLNQNDIIKNLYGEATKLSKILNMLFNDFEIFGDEKREIVLLRDGNENDIEKLIDVYFLDENNNKIEKNGFYSGGPLITYTFANDISPLYTMVIKVETAESMKIIPFKFENINLP